MTTKRGVAAKDGDVGAAAGDQVARGLAFKHVRSQKQPREQYDEIRRYRLGSSAGPDSTQ